MGDYEAAPRLSTEGPGQRQRDVRATQQITQQHLFVKAHRGPLPQASELKAYADIDPAIASAIVAMARENNTTQNVTVRREQIFALARDLASVLAALIFGLAALYGAVTAADHDHPTTAGILATTTLTIGFGALLLRRIVKSERSDHSSQKTGRSTNGEEA
ncbi:hypothetical protein A0U93_09775 [Neoasaia chiangmaiensis]|uniref:DUF2335 domain-containing protein n=1 Tax=Neoasaia chiangmaiensis TaxID=320497 RepID=A0A1U9KQP3_9PROT|nr:hypothetical protein A0U93_09775 [Neoasaia chiangmaiensis]